MPVWMEENERGRRTGQGGDGSRFLLGLAGLWEDLGFSLREVVSLKGCGHKPAGADSSVHQRPLVTALERPEPEVGPSPEPGTRAVATDQVPGSLDGGWT